MDVSFFYLSLGNAVIKPSITTRCHTNAPNGHNIGISRKDKIMIALAMLPKFGFRKAANDRVELVCTPDLTGVAKDLLRRETTSEDKIGPTDVDVFDLGPARAAVGDMLMLSAFLHAQGGKQF